MARIVTLTTTPPPVRVATASAPPEPKMPRMGWLEWTLIAQTVLPALMFVSSLSALRPVLRVAATALPLVAWLAVLSSGRRPAGMRRYPAAGWLAFCAGWMALSIAHPTTNSLVSGAAEASLAISIFCPAFWAPAAIRDARQVRRLVVIVLACNGASSLMGIAQVYRPERFLPPVIPKLEGLASFEESDLTVTTDDGRKYLRPTGLSDSPGYAGTCGVYACLSGLAVVLKPGAWWKRAAAAATAVAGVAVIFYSQGRTTLLMAVAGLVIWALLLLLRRDARALLRLGVVAGLMGAASVGWVMRSGGAAVFKRFYSLTEDHAGSTYYKNRGHFVERALTGILIEYPLGAGMGRTGMMYFYFGDRMAPPDSGNMYAETQIEVWTIDGGAPLLIGWIGALVAAMGSAVLVVLRGPDRELNYWAIVVVVIGVLTLLNCLGNMSFQSQIGMQFWVLMGGLFGADALVREAARRKPSPPGTAAA
jgi:hypothetical protein